MAARPVSTGLVSVSSTVDPFTTTAVTALADPPVFTVNLPGTAVVALSGSL